MSNQVIAVITFMFNYDGTSTSISVDTRKGAVFYNGERGFLMHPMFQATATSATIVSIGGINTTATVAGGVITVTIPSGLTAGQQEVFATLVY